MEILIFSTPSLKFLHVTGKDIYRPKVQTFESEILISETTVYKLSLLHGYAVLICSVHSKDLNILHFPIHKC